MTRSPHVFWLVALAATLVVSAGPLTADPAGWQIDVKFGRSSFAETFSNEDRPWDIDDRADAATVEVGYFFNDYFGVQAGYHDLGTFRGTGSSCPHEPRVCHESLALYAPAVVEAEMTGWSVAAVPTWPLTERLAAYGKLGILERDTELSTDLVLIDGRSPDFPRRSDTELLTGVGVRYRFGKNLGALVEHQRLDVDSTTLGLTYRF